VTSSFLKVILVFLMKWFPKMFRENIVVILLVLLFFKMACFGKKCFAKHQNIIISQNSEKKLVEGTEGRRGM
jgi:hypothetical protein